MSWSKVNLLKKSYISVFQFQFGEEWYNARPPLLPRCQQLLLIQLDQRFPVKIKPQESSDPSFSI